MFIRNIFHSGKYLASPLHMRIEMYIDHNVKCSVALPSFSQNWNISTNFIKILQHEPSLKSVICVQAGGNFCSFSLWRFYHEWILIYMLQNTHVFIVFIGSFWCHEPATVIKDIKSPLLDIIRYISWYNICLLSCIQNFNQKMWRKEVTCKS